MAIILKSDPPPDKKTAAARDVTGLAGFNLDDLAAEGRSKLQQCRSQIHEMLEQAKSQAETLCKEAEARGYEAGLERAAVDAERKLAAQAELRAKESLQLIRQAVSHLHTVHQQWMQDYSASLSTIALAAAERVLHRKLEDEPELLAVWAEAALSSTRSAASLTLAVHPETLAQIGPLLDELLAAPDLPEQTQVVPDQSVGRSEVVVRQHGGEIHAGLQAQLKRLDEVLA